MPLFVYRQSADILAALDIVVSHEVSKGVPKQNYHLFLDTFADGIAKSVLRGVTDKGLEYQVDNSYTDKWKEDIFKCIIDLTDSNGHKFDAQTEFGLELSDTKISANLRIESVDQGEEGVDMESWVTIKTKHYS